MVRVLFFAQVKELLKQECVEIDIDAQVTVDELIQILIDKDVIFEYLKQPHLFIAVEQTICSREQLIGPSDEVAFFPAVTGG